MMITQMINPVWVEVKCRMCGTVYTIAVEENDFYDWQNGKCIQDAMPYLTADERELLISHTCGDCWAEMFSCIGGD